MADPFIGEIRAFCFSFPPMDWAYCNGSKVSVNQFQALNFILAQRFGGDKDTFNLPNLMGRAVIGQGALDNQGNLPLATVIGKESVQLKGNDLPIHTHELNANILKPASPVPQAHLPTRFLEPNNCAYTDKAPNTNLAPDTVQAWPKNETALAHENRQPYQVVNFCIALNGNWPVHP